MTKQKVLRAIKSMVLLLEKGRTTNCMARTKNNIICDPMASDAVKWCPIGAAKKAAERNQEILDILITIIKGFTQRSIIFWNDDGYTSDSEIILAVSMAGIAYEEGLI